MDEETKATARGEALTEALRDLETTMDKNTEAIEEWSEVTEKLLESFRLLHLTLIGTVILYFALTWINQHNYATKVLEALLSAVM